MEKATRQNEVDLVELFLKGVIIVRTNFWMIVLFFCVGTALGLAYYYSSTKVFESKMVVSSSILTRSYSKNLMDRLNRHRGESDLKTLGNLLNLQDTITKYIVNLEIDNISQIDDLKETDRFIITALVLNQDILPELQRGIIHYLENNEYAKVRVEQNKRYLEQMLAKVQTEVNDMEVLKQKIISGAFFENAKGNVMFDPTTVNSKIIELTKEKITLQNNLALVNSVHLIEGFSRFERPSSPKLSISLVSGSLVGLFFVGVLITFKAIRKLIQMSDAAKNAS